MRPLSVLSALALSACASASSSAPPPMQTERVILTDDRIYTTSVPANAVVVLAAPPEKVLVALAETYRGLGVEIEYLDRPAGRLGNKKFNGLRRMAGQQMSHWLSCGESLLGPRADGDRIQMSLVSSATADGKGGTRLETAFGGDAQRVDGTSTDRQTCTTTGRMEEQIRKRVANLLGIPAGK
jgi:hypothetical protein